MKSLKLIKPILLLCVASFLITFVFVGMVLIRGYGDMADALKEE